MCPRRAELRASFHVLGPITTQGTARQRAIYWGGGHGEPPLSQALPQAETALYFLLSLSVFFLSSFLNCFELHLGTAAQSSGSCGNKRG